MIQPPRWAEAVLRVLMTSENAETISGDLLEQYRDSVYPSKGRRRADLWFIGQVIDFAWRATRVWVLLFAAASVGRTALDWLVPPLQFQTRSIVTTYTAISIFVICGTLAAYRTRSLRASAATGLAVGVLAAPIQMVGALLILAIWHDTQTMSAIAHSGGLGEVFQLPVFLFIPGVILALLGGLIGKAAARVFS